VEYLVKYGYESECGIGCAANANELGNDVGLTHVDVNT